MVVDTVIVFVDGGVVFAHDEERLDLGI